MSKPNDVPQDVRDRAEVAFDAILRAGDPSLVIGIIECAIIAEREACAQVAEKATRTTYMAWDMDCVDPVEARIEYREMVADAIRNRSAS